MEQGCEKAETISRNSWSEDRHHHRLWGKSYHRDSGTCWMRSGPPRRTRWASPGSHSWACMRPQGLWRTKGRCEGLEHPALRRRLSQRNTPLLQTWWLLHTPSTTWLFLGNTGVCLHDRAYWVLKEDAFTRQLGTPFLTASILGGFSGWTERSWRPVTGGLLIGSARRGVSQIFPSRGKFPVPVASGKASLMQEKQNLQERGVNGCWCDQRFWRLRKSPRIENILSMCASDQCLKSCHDDHPQLVFNAVCGVSG